MSVLDLSATPAHAGRARPNGWWGMAIFASSEAMLIGSLVGSYFYLRFNTHRWPPTGAPEPSLISPIVLGVALAVSLVPLRGAIAAARRGERGGALGLVAIATGIQAAYLGIQIHLFSDDLVRLQPSQSAYASIYYVLLGAAHAHVALGLLFDLWLLARFATRLTPYRLVALEAIALYWTVVVVLTAVVIVTELSPRL